MSLRSFRGKRLAFELLMLVATLGSCSSSANARAAFQKDDEIITYEVPQEGKQIVRIGFSMNMDWKPLIAALNAHFPTKQFIYDFDVTSGISVPLGTIGDIIKKNDYNFVVSNFWNAPTLGANISEESFLDNYLQTALKAIASDGQIYGLPLPTSACGMYYNKTLFKDQGWSIPQTLSDFVSFAKAAKAAGYLPFSSCFKYEGQVTRVLQGMLSDQLFASTDGMSWYDNLIHGKANFADYAKPMFETAKTLFDEGIFSLDSFSASLTTMRKNFFDGKTAMIDYSSDIYSMATSEGAKIDIGLAPYPSTSGANGPVLYSSSVVLFIPAAIKNDKIRYAFDTSVMSYLSTPEGQDAVLTGWNGVPSLKKYTGTNALYGLVEDYVKKGTYRSILDFAADQDMVKPLKTLIKNAVQSIGEGTAIDTAIATLDTAYHKALEEGVGPSPTYEKIGEASEDFSVLETSYYLADKMKAATGADFAVMPSGGFYRSNMAYITKGDITSDARLFYQKGIASKDYITTYSLTGKQIETLLEKPIINGVLLNQFLAPSGLKMTYSPWHEQGKRLSDVSLEDGSTLDETKSYTVASYAGAIDQSYITSTLASFPLLGDPEAFALASLKADKKIAPKLTNRLTLKWDVQA